MKTVLQILQWYRPRERWVLEVAPAPREHRSAHGHVPRRHDRGHPPRPGGGRAVDHHHGHLRRPHGLPRRRGPSGTATTGPTASGACSTRRSATGTCCPEDRTIDVYFHEYMADEMGTVQRVYDAAGIELTDEARAEIAALPGRPPAGEGRPGGLRPPRRLLHHTRGGALPLRGLPRGIPQRTDRGPVNIQEQVDHLIDTRPGRQLLTPVYDDPAHPIVDGLHLPLGRHHRGLHDPHRQRPHHRQHRHGLRGPAPQAGVRRHPPRAHPPHHHDPGPRRPRRRRRPVQGAGHHLHRPGQQPGVPARRQAHPGPAGDHGRDLVRHARHRGQAHLRREPRRLDEAVRTRARHPVRGPARPHRRRPAHRAVRRGGRDHRLLHRLAAGAPDRARVEPVRAAVPALPEREHDPRRPLPLRRAAGRPPTAWSASCGRRCWSPAATSPSSAPT